MKALLIILLLVLSSTSFAESRWYDVSIDSRDFSFVSGYVSASIYDLAYRNSSPNNTKSVVWKTGLGLLAGTAVAIGEANKNGSSMQFGNIIFGGIGGLACVVIHF